MPDQAQTLDPAFSTQFGERAPISCLYDTLITYDQQFNLHPGLARSWKLADGGRQLILNLQPNVKFHDGTPCDAHAVKWNLDRFLDKKVNSPWASVMVPPLQQVKVESATQVRVLLSKPWRPLLGSLADRPGYIVSPTAAMKYGKAFGSHPVGTGAFTFVSWVPGGDITVKRNPAYWQKGKPYLDEVVCKNVMDNSVAIEALQSNSVQVISDIEPGSLGALLGNQNVVVNKFKGGAWYATQYDVSKPPFNNPLLVEAQGYGANRDAAIKLAFGGQGIIPAGPILSGWAAPPAGAPNPYPYDPAKAAAAVQKAGAAGKQQLTLVTATDYAIFSNMVQALLPGYKQAGLNITLQGVQNAVLYAGQQSGKYNWSETFWTPRPDPDGLLRILFQTGYADNTTRFSDPQVDHWLNEAAELYDQNKAKPIYEKILAVVGPKGGYNYIAAPDQIAAVRSNIGGLVQYPDDIIRPGELYYIG